MTCIIVLGCFRSGTSAVAGALHHLGIFMGEKFDPPGENNPKGFWEDLEFKRIHQICDDCLIDSYENQWKDFEDEYKSLIQKREQHPIWGIKDPLLCRQLPTLLEYVITSKVIVCRRPIREIAKSMARAIRSNDWSLFEPLAKGYVDDMNLSLSKYQGPVLEVQKTDNMLQSLDSICDFVGLPKNQAVIDFLS